MTRTGSVFTRSLRGLVAAALALMMVAVMAVGSAVSSQTIDPNAKGTLVITQLEAGNGTRPGTGLPEDTSGKTPVPGVKFTATLVPGTNLTTNEGWAEAQALTAKQAAERVEDADPTASGVTDSNGELVFADVPLGLYYVDPVSAPGGYTTGSPFLVALPMTNADSLGQWLYTVHVYPKNARADIELLVRDEDAVKRGDLVDWESLSSIPMHALDGYAVEHVLPQGLQLFGGVGGVQVSFTCPKAPKLMAGVDYKVVVDGQRIFVEFTGEGLKKLETAAAGSSPGKAASTSTQAAPCRVKVSYETKVLEDGEFVVEARLYPSKAAIDSGLVEEGVTTATAATKWGPVEIIVSQVGKPEVRIPNVCFQLYPSKKDAENRTNKIVIDGVSEWVTDENGLVHIDGLRFSDFVNGSVVGPDDPLYRTYYAVMTCVPDGWHGISGPLPLIVDSAITADVALVELYPLETKPPTKPVPPTSPGGPGQGGLVPGKPGLPTTGASVLGALVVGGLALFMGAWLRRRRKEEQEA